MAWKWYVINSYKVSVGSDTPASGYGSVQLIGTGFYGLLRFAKSGPLQAATAPVVGSEQRFYGSLDFAQMEAMVDVLRHEKPINFGWFDGDPNVFHLMTGSEPTGEAEGVATGMGGRFASPAASASPDVPKREGPRPGKLPERGPSH